MSWEAARTLEFDEWWEGLRRPLVVSVYGSRYSNMKELRVGKTIRIFFAFDPHQVAILLIGGDKAGKTKRFYKQMVRKADRIYKEHLEASAPGHTKENSVDGGNEEIQGTQRGSP